MFFNPSIFLSVYLLYEEKDSVSFLSSMSYILLNSNSVSNLIIKMYKSRRKPSFHIDRCPFCGTNECTQLPGDCASGLSILFLTGDKELERWPPPHGSVYI